MQLYVMSLVRPTILWLNSAHFILTEISQFPFHKVFLVYLLKEYGKVVFH